MNIRNRISSKLFRTIVVVGTVAAAAFGVAVSARVPGSFTERHACSGNSGLRVVDKTDMCNPGEQAMTWRQSDQAAGTGTSQISIIFDQKGNIFKGTGFTVTYFGPGQYLIDFPPGSFTALPAPNVTPFSGLNVNPTVTGLLGRADGSGWIYIVVREPDGTLEDSSLIVNVTL